MTDKMTLTFTLMDPPYESARTTTAMRLIHAAVERGIDVNVFAYEGSVMLPFAQQKAHPNSVHGRDAAEENHPLPKDWIADLLALAEARKSRLDWVNCGLCADERGADPVIPGIRRGTPGDLVKFVETSENSIVIPTR